MTIVVRVEVQLLFVASDDDKPKMLGGTGIDLAADILRLFGASSAIPPNPRIRLRSLLRCLSSS